MSTVGFDLKRHSLVLIVVATYFVVSISMVFINKVLLYTTQFHAPIPIFITWFQCLIAVIVCWLLGEMSHYKIAGTYVRQDFDVVTAIKVLPLSCLFVFMILLNQLCLQYVEVSFYNVARSLTILFNVLLSYCILRQPTSWKAMGTILIVILGFYLGADGEVNLSLIGTLFGVSSSLFVALYTVYTSSFLSYLEGNKDKLMFYNNFNSLVLLIPLTIWFEKDIIVEGFFDASSAFWVMMIVAGLLGYLIGVVTMWQIQVTSPLTHNISGTAKASVQTILALFIWKNPITIGGIIGIALILGGSCAYSIVRMNESKKNPTPIEKPIAKEQYSLLSVEDTDSCDDLESSEPTRK